MRVAILHNPRPDTTSPHLPDDAFEEFDAPETIEALAAALAPVADAIPVVADRRMPGRLEDGRFDAVFNIAEGHGRRCREAIPAAVCELLGLPYTFSDPLTLAITLDKSIARRVVSPEVPVAPAVLIEHSADPLDALPFPVIVKPNDEGSSKGIRHNSICATPAEAADRCRALRDAYHCPVLVEQFLPGPEITVAVRGNGPDTHVLGSMEIAPADPSSAPFLYSVEVKRDFRHQVRYHIPPRLSPTHLAAVHHNALAAWRLLGCRDLARFDFRLDAAGRPCFLECNPLPGLNPHSSDVVILSRAITTYDDMVRKILHDALARRSFVTQWTAH